MEHLLPFLSDAVAGLDAQVARLGSAASVSAYARRNGGTQVRIDGGGTTCAPVPPDAGVTFSAWTGRRFIEESTDRLDAAGIAAAATALAQRLARCAVEPDGLPLAGATERQQQQSFEQPMIEDPRQIPPGRKIALAQALRERIRSGAGAAAEAVAVVGDVHADIAVVDRQRQLVQHLHRVRLITLPTWRDGQQQVQLHGGFERIGGWEHLEAELASHSEPSWLRALRRDGPRLLGAGRISDPGAHTCVLSGDFSGLFAHEAFGHGTEQDLYLKERSEGAHWLGKPVASPLVNLIDDPANGWAASYFFDDEGIPAQPTQIIRDGQLVAGLNDRLSHAWLAHQGLRVPKTANGRREAYDHKPYARMTNTAFCAGSDPALRDDADLIAGVEHGYHLTHPSNGMEDPKGWGIQLEGAMAEEIRDGRLTGKVFGPVVVTGHVPDLLMSIDAVGRTVIEASVGTCGKGYKEWVKVTDGGPALRLRATIA